MTGLWVLIHLLGVIVWLGGMFFALFCLRPALPVLPAPNRAALMADALGRFFNAVTVAILAIWVSGFFLLAPVGMQHAAPGWHVMIGAALLMTIVFAIIRLMFYPAVKRAIAKGELPVAAAGLNRIRWLVIANLLLGVIALWGVTSA